jgi:hypothetical protein
MNKFDRRKQPNTTIKAIGAVLPELKWPIKEVANNHFKRLSGRTNESYGYNLVIPKEFPFLNKLWVGYMNHEDVMPGIYSCIDYNFCKAKPYDPLDYGYGEAPFDFFLIYKKILLLEEVEKMEENFGKKELKKRIKFILQKIYPFSIK